MKKKRDSQPPPFHTIEQLWRESKDANTLRFGQWFIGHYMPTAHGVDIDVLWNTTDLKQANALILNCYEVYHWEM